MPFSNKRRHLLLTLSWQPKNAANLEHIAESRLVAARGQELGKLRVAGDMCGSLGAVRKMVCR